MQRRIIAAITAVVLAGIGAILLFNYVAGADARAMAGQEPGDVYVVKAPIPAGTFGSEIAAYVEQRQLPRVAIVSDAIQTKEDLVSVATLTTTAELQVGEQLLRTRFGEPGTSGSGAVKVADNMQLLTVQLEPQRLVGGSLSAGDEVAIYVTVENKIQQILPKVQVTHVGGEEAAGMITVALAPPHVQRLVLSMEAGKVWLAKAAKSQTPTSPISIKQILG